MKEKLFCGISAPLLTPFCADGTVNYEEYGRLTAYVSGNGVGGLFIGGTSGEFVNLTVEEREGLLKAAKKSAASGTRLLFNTTAMNLQDMERLCAAARREGADAVSITAPYYHPYDAAALVAYFQRACALAGELPVYLYNMVSMTHNPITPDILKAVKDTCPNLRGVKDSSMDFMVILEYQALLEDPDFEIITGNDAQMLTNLQAGGAGALVASARVFPALCAGVLTDFEAGELSAARARQTTILHLRDLFRSVMPIMAHKRALDLQGFHMGPARFPFRDLTAGENTQVERRLRALGLI